MRLLTTISTLPRRTMLSTLLIASIVSTGCTTNYLTNSTEGTYGVPVTERTIPQRLLDRSIEHTAKINAYGLQQNLQQNSRMSIDSFYSEVLLTGEIPTEELKTQVEEVIGSMPDVRKVYNELNVSVARGYSSNVQDGYISSKITAKVLANNSIKSSQIKVVTNTGVVYVMGRLTPTQQSHLIDIANSTAGVTELVLLTTLVNDTGAPISDEDIMFENNVSASADAQPLVATPIVRNAASTSVPASSVNEPVPTEQDPSSTYVDLYGN
ncbi:BON domain-containing protein [Psychrobacter jeotgali]|uniref:BON domain-containing protein n=1 Tax=Psychrobacter jeotgali TaxID=179010 RepID=UPI001D0FE59B|nr:BON domain-containing protein [Psychrobacter jeotgali]